MTCAAVLWRSRSSRTNGCGTASWSRLTKSWQEDHRLLRAKRSAATSRVPCGSGKKYKKCCGH
ncbi:MAG: SEC-C metal-binding domain-containing protein [Selenomonas artemidis]